MKQFTVYAYIATAVWAENGEEAADKLGAALIDAFPGDLFNEGVNDIAVDVVYPGKATEDTALEEKFNEMLNTAILPGMEKH